MPLFKQKLRWTEAELRAEGYRYERTVVCPRCRSELVIYYLIGKPELRLDEGTLEVHVCDAR